MSSSRYSLIFLTLFISINLNYSLGLGLSDEIISISHENTYHSMDLDYQLREGGKFQLKLALLNSSNTAIIFSYEVNDHIQVNQNNEINHSIIMGLNSVNGSLEPGNSIQISHSIVKCVSDVGIPFYFDFILIMNSTAELSIEIQIEEYGEDSCGPQIGPDISNFEASLLIILVIIILLTLNGYLIKRTIKRLRK